MKKKTINAVICKKFDQFVSSIKDDNVKKLVAENSLITGGCIASMLLKEPVNDFDVYFTNKETVLAVAEYYVKMFNDEHEDNGRVEETDGRVKIVFQSKGVAGEVNEDAEGEALQIEDTDNNFKPVFLSANAITLSNKIQIVIRFYGEATEIHENYDFIHCTNYWTSKERKVVLNQAALESILAKELVYIGSKYPVASVIRTRKFIKREWTINAGQYLKMCFQISSLDPTDVKVLEDQLTGVDTSYFLILIDALKTKIEKEDQAFKLNYNYVSEIINRIF